MERGLDLQRAVLGQLGRHRAADLIGLGTARKAEDRRRAAAFEATASIDGTERELATPMRADAGDGRTDEIRTVAIPQVGPDDPPVRDRPCEPASPAEAGRQPALPGIGVPRGFPWRTPWRRWTGSETAIVTGAQTIRHGPVRALRGHPDRACDKMNIPYAEPDRVT